MTAIEILEWLKEHNHMEDEDTTMVDLFSEDCVCEIISRYTPQEILDRIEKYKWLESEVDE